MGKDRARKRAEREREAAIRAAARAAEAERRERKNARIRALKAATTDRLPTFQRAGQQTGVLARRRRRQNLVLLAIVLVVHLLVWFVARDWGVQFFALVVTLLFVPVLKTLLFKR